MVHADLLPRLWPHLTGSAQLRLSRATGFRARHARQTAAMRIQLWYALSLLARWHRALRGLQDGPAFL